MVAENNKLKCIDGSSKCVFLAERSNFNIEPMYLPIYMYLIGIKSLA